MSEWMIFALGLVVGANCGLLFVYIAMSLPLKGHVSLHRIFDHAS